jgi:Family of unknown function (DUF5996)
MKTISASRQASQAGSPWPELTLASWKDTCETLHIWTQVVGKIRLALEPMANHWWQVTLYVSARGLTTSLMHGNGAGLEIEFDFIDHDLVFKAARGDVRRLPLKAQPVADFYAETMATLTDLGVEVSILARPVEVPESIPFAADQRRRPYDAGAAKRFWLALSQMQRVLAGFRAGFIGKASPVHFFWGGFDLAVTRFSGRTAPEHPGGVPNCADWVMKEAYSHEVSSCGYWPGGGAEGCFYAYAYPEPDGFADCQVEPAEAYYDHELGEFLLPYTAVRTADEPDKVLLSFVQGTYDAAADLGRWDRKALERGGGR